MKTLRQIRQQINEFKEIKKKGGNPHDEMVKTLSKHFQNVHGVNPQLSSAGEDDARVTILHHPDVKHEYSVNGNTDPIAMKSHPDKGEHHVLNVNTNTGRVSMEDEDKARPPSDPLEDFMKRRKK